MAGAADEFPECDNAITAAGGDTTSADTLALRVGRLLLSGNNSKIEIAFRLLRENAATEFLDDAWRRTGNAFFQQAIGRPLTPGDDRALRAVQRRRRDGEALDQAVDYVVSQMPGHNDPRTRRNNSRRMKRKCRQAEEKSNQKLLVNTDDAQDRHRESENVEDMT